jgi:gamma-glutamyltranspeptidase / glutathione hydrolase
MKIFATFLLFVAMSATAAEQAILSEIDIFHPVIAEHGMVSTQHHLATEAGLQVLREGGNAIDAAVTVGFTLAVVLPRAGNIGGGGFMLAHLADRDQTVALDYRETAPAAARRNMYLDEKGDADPQLSRYSHRAVGVPGTVAGLCLVLEKYGTISLQRALQPAIEFASGGFPVERPLHEALVAVQPRMETSAASMKIFYADGKPPAIGETLVQTDLAWSLQQIAAQGPGAFYRGEIARKLVADMQAHGGLITHRDLEGYRPVLREPLRGYYRGYEIAAMPPPSSGGVHLIQMLNMLEAFPIDHMGQNSAAVVHLMIETMKRAYADRARHLGDADFVPVPVDGLIAKSYADSLRRLIDLQHATPSARIQPGRPQDHESNETTHFSVIDDRGNAVVNTYTLNLSYGTKRVAAGTGILLNNQMDDFSAKPGSPNAYGLVGGEFNAIAPGKRMLSSMTPVIVMREGRPFLLSGSPGGSRIITTVLQIVLNVIDHGMNIAAATNAVRVHHQWLPDELRIEQGYNTDSIRLLETMGHRVVVKDAMGGTQSIVWRDGLFRGASDPRRPGGLTAGW